MKNQPTQAAIIRNPNSVSVSVEPPEKLQQAMAAEAQPRVWAKVASVIATETPTPVEPSPKMTAEELLAETLSDFIKASRWGFYVIPNPKCRVFDGTTFIYNNPHPPFWNLYRLAKGIFRDLGIMVTKTDGAWEVRIPIRVLTDKVFVESGLAGVELVMRRGTRESIPARHARITRERQYARTKRGMAAVKKMRRELRDAEASK